MFTKLLSTKYLKMSENLVKHYKGEILQNSVITKISQKITK